MDFVKIKLVNTQRQNDTISIMRLGFPNCGHGSRLSWTKWLFTNSIYLEGS